MAEPSDPRPPTPDPLIEDLVSALRSGKYRALAQAVSLVERDDGRAERLLASIYPSTGRARIVGITGAPGAGKSTLIASLAKYYRRQEKRVGIIAVDPTSPFTGGAILGDRIRMADLYTDRGVFIRSMATRGFLGGLAKATNDVVDLLDAAGFDIVLVETVGVGQDEVEIIRTVQTNVVVLVPGMGDDIQAIKAGIMEIGDVFAVNKADRPGADRTVTEITMMMSLVEEHGDWIPPIVKTVASTNQGTEDLDAAIVKHFEHIQSSGELDRRNRERVRIRIETTLKEKFMDRLIGNTITRADYEQLLDDVLRKRNNPHDAAEGLLARVSFGR
jgi:LAO/AO transport system kinase